MTNEQEGIEGLVEPDNPEDILIGKKLMQMALNTFLRGQKVE